MFKNLNIIAAACFINLLLSCSSKPPKSSVKVTVNQAKKQTVVTKKLVDSTVHTTEMTFVEYNDDGDYFQFIAQKGDSITSFINNNDSSRHLNRGDHIAVKWKNGTITMPGDDDAEVAAKLLISVKKTGDGAVSEFRKNYGKKIKYTWAPSEEYSESYLDKIYLLAEYYLAQTNNPLLQHAISQHDELNYSIESKNKNNRAYIVLGFGVVGPNGTNIIQWVYIDQETYYIYEYDLPNDKLVPFH